MNKHLLRCAAVVGACLAPIGTAVSADVVKLIGPTAAGGGTDGFYRTIAREAEKNLGANIVIVNVGGAGGTIGVGQMARSEPDGLTMAGVWLGPVTVAPHTIKASYTMDDYIPVLQLTSAPYVLCVRPEFPAESGREFVEELRRNPGKYTYGTDGVAGPGQLATERVFQALKIKAIDVPYKGAGETLPALLSKTIDIYTGSVPPGVGLEKSNRGKCLLSTSAEPLKALPKAVSLGELGIPKEETMLWRGILVPKGTPADKVARIRDAFSKAAQTDSVRSVVEAAGEDIVIYTGADWSKRLHTEYDTFGKLVKSLNLKPDDSPAPTK